MAELEKLYAEAKQELNAKHIDRASALLKQILVQDESYRDASRLLAQIIQRKRRKWFSHPLFYVGIAIIALSVIGILLLPGILMKVRGGNSTPPPDGAASLITSTPEVTVPSPTPTSSVVSLPFHWVRINNGQEFLRDAIVTLAADPMDTDVIYVGTRHAGVYKTIDSGESWQPANTGLDRLDVKMLIIDPENPKILYLHAGNVLYKTLDGALTWKKSKDIEAFVMDPRDPRHLYANAGTIVETFDSGETWSRPTGADRCGEGVTKMVVDWLDSNKLYATCWNGVYKSENGGKNWQILKEFKNLQNIAASVLPDGQTGIVAIGSDPEGLGSLWLYKTTESKWILKERACGVFAVDPDNPASIHCDGYHSLDGGITWPEGINWGFLWENRISSIIITNGKNPLIFVAGEEGGIFRSADGGSTFSPLSKNGLPGVGYELVISPFNDSLLIIVQKDSDWRGGSSYISTDSGDNWERIPKGEGLSNFSFDADGSTIYTYGINYENLAPVLWKTKDFSETWTGQVIPGEQKPVSGIWSSPVQSGALLLYLDYPEFRLIRTLDGGETWERIPGTYQLTKEFQFIGYGTRVFTYNDLLSTTIFSDDLFSTENSCEYMGSAAFLSKPALAVLPDSQFVLYYALPEIGIVRSKDQCTQWIPLPSQPGNINIHSLTVDPANPDIVYAGTNDGVFITLNAGGNWGLVTEGLLGANLIYSLGVDSKGNVLAVTPYGIFKLEEK